MRIILSRAAFCLPMLALPAYADCSQEIRAVMERATTSGPYIAHFISKTGETTEESVAEVIPPGAVHSWNAAGDNEMILLNGRAWYKQFGAWVELPRAAARTNQDNLKFLDNMSDPVCKGDMVVDGETFIGYSYTYAAEGFASATTLLVDPDTGLLEHILSKDHVGDTTVTMITDYTFGVTLEIVAPL